MPSFKAQDNDVFTIVISDESSLKQVQSIVPGAHVYGNGTKDNPYVLENITIHALGRQGILIEHFTKYLVLKDIKVYGTSVKPDILMTGLKGGIAVYDSSHISLKNVTLYGNWVGIYIQRSNNVIIEDSKIVSNNVGLRIKNSKSVTVLSTIFVNNYDGIKITDSNDVKVEKSTFIDVFNYAIDVLLSSSIEINDNTYIYNHIAVMVERSYGILLSGNTFIENGNGIILYKNVKSSNITGNCFYRNYAYAISILLSCSDITVYLNAFLYNMGTTDVFVNKSQAQDLKGVASWNTSKYGNYWLDLAGISEDANNDGILETAYPISSLNKNTFDWKPLAYPPLQINVSKIKENTMKKYTEVLGERHTSSYPPSQGGGNSVNVVPPEEFRKLIEENKKNRVIMEISAGVAIGGSIVFLIISLLMKKEFIKR